MVSDNPNFGTLSEDKYAKYFNLLSNIFHLLLACYPDETVESYEAGLMPVYLGKLLFTVEMLRLKYTYGFSQTRSLWIDLTDSGFPNAQEINNIMQDLLGRKERLRLLPAKSILKQTLLDYMLKHYEESPELLRQLSEREYLSMLSEEKLFLSFTPGEIIRKQETKEQRSYVFSWACFDFQSNRPYIHLMTFDQDVSKQPLEERGITYQEFLDVVRAEGSRTPDVAILAFAIDDAVESIHPKIIKRLCIGPLYAGFLMEDQWKVEDEKQKVFREILCRYKRSENDFVLFMSDEIIFSKAQQVTRGILSPLGKVREVFAITETDPECFSRRASLINHNVLLPHWLLQNEGSSLSQTVSEFEKCRKITYDDRRRIEIHGI